MNQDNTPELEERNVELSITEVQSDDSNQPISIDVEAPSDDLAERMANAFDKNLDNLIRDVQAPPPPVKIKKPKKVKEVKVKKVKVKISRYQPISSGGEKSFASFLGRKIASSFSLAATARKNAKEMGDESRGRGFFLKKALGFEFGGDLISRTKGTFSSNPAEEQDPGLSKGQRFGASIGKYIKPNQEQIVKPTDTGNKDQLSLFDTSKYITVKNNSVRDVLKNSLDKLKNSHGNLEKAFNKLSSKPGGGSDTNLFEVLDNAISDLKKSITKNTSVQKKISTITRKQISVEQDTINDQESAQREASLEKTQDLTGVRSYSDPYAKMKGGKGLVGQVIDFISGDYGDDDDDGGGGGIDIDIDGGRRRRPGTRRRFARKQGNRFKRWAGKQVDRLKGFATRNIDKGKNLFQKGIQSGKGLADKGRQAVSKGKQLVKGGIEAGKGLVGRGLQTAKGLFNSGKNAVSAGIQGTKGWWDNVGAGVAKRFAFAGAKNAGKYAPGILSTAAYAGDTADRLKRGDKFGAWLNAIGYGSDVAATGLAAASAGPQAPATGSGAGIASIISATADSINFVRDVFIGPTQEKKLSSGGMIAGGVPAMVGEAGPELITPPGGFNTLAMSPMMSTSLFSSIGVLLGSTKKIIADAGPSAAGVKPFIENIIGPLSRRFDTPTYAMTTKVGKNLSGVKEPTMDGGFMGFIKKLLKFVLGQSEDDIGDDDAPVKPPGPMGSGSDFWTLVAIASREDGDPQGQADVAQAIYNRLHSGAYSGKTIRELIIADMQFEPTWKYPKPGSTGKANPEWQNITDAQTAAAATGMSAGAMESVARAISDPTLQENARQFVGARTDFKGGSNTPGPTDVQRTENSPNNFFGFHANYKGDKGVASVPNFNAGSTPAPTTPPPAGTPIAGTPPAAFIAPGPTTTPSALASASQSGSPNRRPSSSSASPSSLFQPVASAQPMIYTSPLEGTENNSSTNIIAMGNLNPPAARPREGGGAAIIESPSSRLDPFSDLHNMRLSLS